MAEPSLSQHLLDHLGVGRLANRPGHPYWPQPPGNVFCPAGHPFVADEVGECANCESKRDVIEDIADYRTLAYHIIGLLNPAKNDVEVQCCMDAVTAMETYVDSLPCRCNISQDGSPCGRCNVLGRYRDEKVRR